MADNGTAGGSAKNGPAKPWPAKVSLRVGDYTKPGRLGYVLALIQVLALDKETYKSDLPGKKTKKAENQLTPTRASTSEISSKERDTERGDKSCLVWELAGPPNSRETWTHIAEQHPELFRVSTTENLDKPISLLARHVTPAPEGAGSRKPPLPEAMVARLISTAIELHDAAARRKDRSIQVLLAILIVVISSSATIYAALHSRR